MAANMILGQTTFVVLNWHAEALTLRCVASIVHQPGVREHDIVIVDNESTNGSYGTLRAAFSGTIHRNVSNKGFAGGCNSALQYVTTDLVAFINNDAIVDPQWLTNAQRHFTDPSVALVGGCEYAWDGSEGAGAVSSDLLSVPNFLLMGGAIMATSRVLPVTKVAAVMGSNMLIRTSVFREVGGFDEDYFAYWEETDLCARLLAMQRSLIYEPASQIFHIRNHSANRMPFKKVYLNRRNQLTFIAKHYPDWYWLRLVIRRATEDVWFGIIGRQRGLRRSGREVPRLSPLERWAHVLAGGWGITHLCTLFARRGKNKRNRGFAPDFLERVSVLQSAYDMTTPTA